MFDNILWRFALRAVLVGVLASLAALKSSIGGGLDAAEVVDVISAFLGAAAAYAGIGAVVPQVEPSVGNQLDTHDH